MISIKNFIFVSVFVPLLSIGFDYHVCLDPGHTGRSDPGALGLNNEEQPDESDFNLYIAEAADDELMWYAKTVLMTRHSEDTFPPPTRLNQVDRAKIANGFLQNDLGQKGFCYCAVSIHCNADTNYSPAHGTETYFAYYYGQGRLLAQFVQDSMFHQIAGAPYANNRGIKWKGHIFTKQTISPSCLAELAFVTHPDSLLPGQWNQLVGDLWMLKTNGGIGIAHGICGFLGPFSPPKWLRPSGNQKGNVSLMWSPSSSSGVNYNLYRREHPDTVFTLIASNISDTSYTDNTVTDGKTYSYYVAAISGGTESIRSNILTIHTPPFYSNYALATGKNNAVKTIFDDNGINRLAYTSDSSMFCTYSTDYGSVWSMSQSLDYGFCPALAIDASNHPHLVSAGCAGQPDTASGEDTSYVIFFAQYLSNKWDNPPLYVSFDTILSVSFAIDPLDTGWVVFNTYDDVGNNKLKIGKFYTQTIPESLENVLTLDTYTGYGNAAVVIRPSDCSIWIVYERNNTIVCKWRSSYGNWTTRIIQSEGVCPSLSVAGDLVHFIWEKYFPDINPREIQTCYTNGFGWSRPQTIATVRGKYCYPYIEKGAVAVWSDLYNNQWEIYASQRDEFGSWTTPQNISQTAVDSKYP